VELSIEQTFIFATRAGTHLVAVCGDFVVESRIAKVAWISRRKALMASSSGSENSFTRKLDANTIFQRTSFPSSGIHTDLASVWRPEILFPFLPATFAPAIGSGCPRPRPKDPRRVLLRRSDVAFSTGNNILAILWEPHHVAPGKENVVPLTPTAMVQARSITGVLSNACVGTRYLPSTPPLLLLPRMLGTYATCRLPILRFHP